MDFFVVQVGNAHPQAT